MDQAILIWGKVREIPDICDWHYWAAFNRTKCHRVGRKAHLQTILRTQPIPDATPNIALRKIRNGPSILVRCVNSRKKGKPYI